MKRTPTGHGTMKRMVLALTSVALLAGCSEPKSVSDVASASERVLAQEEVLVPAEPAWFAETIPDETRLYATTTRVSPDWQMAINLSENQARVDLAQHLDVWVKAMEKEFDEQIVLGGDTELLQTSQVVAKTVTSQSLTGSYVEKKETHMMPDGQYRVFVRMVLDLDLVRERYLEEIKKHKKLETQLRSTEAFEELEREVEAYREEQESRDA
jgi:hypothetical protein